MGIFNVKAIARTIGRIRSAAGLGECRIQCREGQHVRVESVDQTNIRQVQRAAADVLERDGHPAWLPDGGVTWVELFGNRQAGFNDLKLSRGSCEVDHIRGCGIRTDGCCVKMQLGLVQKIARDDVVIKPSRVRRLDVDFKCACPLKATACGVWDGCTREFDCRPAGRGVKRAPTSTDGVRIGGDCQPAGQNIFNVDVIDPDAIGREAPDRNLQPADTAGCDDAGRGFVARKEALRQKDWRAHFVGCGDILWVELISLAICIKLDRIRRNTIGHGLKRCGRQREDT